MKLLIVDKDIETRLKIKTVASSFDQIINILESQTAEDALFSIYENEPSIMIISNDLPNRKGFELAHLLNKQNHSIQTIVISEDKEEAIEAIRARVTDFVVSPFKNKALATSLRKIIAEIDSKTKTDIIQYDGSHKIKIPSNQGFQLINLMDLAYCVADGTYTKIVFCNEEYIVSSSYLSRIEKTLEGYHFAKISRSHIVNLRLIKEIDFKRQICVLELSNSIKEIKTSKIYLSSFEGKYLSR